MKQIIKALLMISVIWLIFDRTGSEVMWWLNQHSQDNTSSKIKHIVEGVSEDVIMMGTSRCNGHYVPPIISDTLHMSVYNAGIDGSDNIFAQYMALCYILHRHTPKVVCLEVQNSFLEEEEDSYHTTGYFAPYFGNNAAADSIYHLAGTYWQYKLSHLYRYNTKVLANITGQIVNHSCDEHGYTPNPMPANRVELSKWPNEYFHVNTEKKAYMERFIQACREKNVFLCFVISPSYSVVDSSYYALLKDFAANHHVPLFDYHTSGLYLDKPDYFRDSSHLWDKSAKEYSSIFASDLKQLDHIQKMTTQKKSSNA